MSRRARSAASRMRAREARTSVSCTSVSSCSRAARSASRRAVMSKIAPSSHQRPSPACWARPRSSTQRIEPSRWTIRYSSPNGRPVATDSMTRSATYSWSSGCSMLANVRTALSMKSLAG